MELNREQVEKALEDALTLIRKLTEENDRLEDLVKEVQEYNEAFVEDNGKLRVSNRRLLSLCKSKDVVIVDLNDRVKSIKADTVRKMWEMVKERSALSCETNGLCVTMNTVDRVAKELLEGAGER